MTKKRLVNTAVALLSFGLGAALFVWLIQREGTDSIIDNLLTFGFWPFVGFVLISFLNFILYSWRWQLIINKHLPDSKDLPLWRIYLHRMAGFAVSYLTPAAQVGGEPARIAMLTTDKVPVRHATSSVLLDIAFEMTAYIAFIVAGVALAVYQGLGDGGSFAVILVVLGIVLFGLGVFFWAVGRGHGFFSTLYKRAGLRKIKFLKRFEEPLCSMENMMTNFLQGDIRLIALVAFLSITVISFRVIEVFYLAHFFGFEVNFAQAFLVSTLPGIALLLPVPGSVGVFEGSFGLVFALLAIPINPVSFALIIRSRDLVFIFVGISHMMTRGGKFLRARLTGEG